MSYFDWMRYPYKIVFVLVLYIFIFPPEGMFSRALSGEASETSQAEGKNESPREDCCTWCSQSLKNRAKPGNKRVSGSDIPQISNRQDTDGRLSVNAVSDTPAWLMVPSGRFSTAILRI